MGEAGQGSGPPALAGLGQWGRVRVELLPPTPELGVLLGHRDPHCGWVLRVGTLGTFSHMCLHEGQIQILPYSPFFVFD